MFAGVRWLGACAWIAALVAPACGSDVPVGPLRDAAAECDELEAACQKPAAALGEPYQSCYETGKDAVPNACRGVYYDCIAKCHAALDSLGEGGEGGQGGAGAGAGGQAGAS